MLAKKNKLPIQNFVGKRGRLVKSGLFLVKIFPSSTAQSRFGVTISAKVAPKATDRNRLRRLIYGAIQEYYNRIPSADYWITLLAPAAKATKATLKSELLKLLTTNY